MPFFLHMKLLLLGQIIIIGALPLPLRVMPIPAQLPFPLWPNKLLPLTLWDPLLVLMLSL